MTPTASSSPRSSEPARSRAKDPSGGAAEPDAGLRAGHRPGRQGDFAAELRERRLARTLAQAARRALEREAGEGQGPGAAGPLGHQRAETLARPAAEPGAASQPVEAVAQRILSGVDGAGRASTRVDLGGLAAGDWAGTTVELVAGARGVEVSVLAQTSAARRVVETRLADLARALSENGVKVGRLRVHGSREAARGDNGAREGQDGGRL